MSTELRVWRLCEHGKSYAHMYQVEGRKLSCRAATQTPATAADLVAALIAEGGETIWWCKEHGSTVLTREPDSYSMCLWMLHEDNWDALPEPEDCRFVKKLLYGPIPVESAEATPQLEGTER